jgi:glycosyltransferase involved in cell wall biosynthesis
MTLSSPSSSPEVSVILPTCDRPQLVRQSVESVLSQTLTDFELLLVDNNRRSPPVRQNPELEVARNDPRVCWLEAPHARNASMSRNVGLAAARGRWIAFLDDDDTYLPEKLAAQHALATARQAAIVLCGFELVWPHRRRMRQVDRELFRGDEMLTHAVPGSPMLFHRHDDGLRFDERLSAGEDMRYVLQFIRRHAVTEVPCVARPLVRVTQQTGPSVHANKDAVWRAYQESCFAARGNFSRRARRAFLARGRLDRALGGYGGTAFLLRSILGVLRSSTPRKWRFATYAILARIRR